MHSLDLLEKLNKVSHLRAFAPALSLCCPPLQQSFWSCCSNLVFCRLKQMQGFHKTFQFVALGEVAGWPVDGLLTQLLREGVRKACL